MTAYLGRSRRMLINVMTLLFCLGLPLDVWQENNARRSVKSLKTETETVDAKTVSASKTDFQANPEPVTNSVDEATKAKILQNFGQTPLHFEPNNGQGGNDEVRFMSRVQGYNLFLSPTKAILALRQTVFARNKSKKSKRFDTDPLKQILNSKPEDQDHRQAEIEMEILGAKKDARSTGAEELAGRSNYFLGNDSTKWRTDVANYKRVRFEEVYEGIDLEYYGNQRQLEYDFIVEPHANPDKIKLQFKGVKKVKVDETSGELILQTPLGEIRQKKPFVYQTDETTGERREIVSGYKIQGTEVRFSVAEYDKTKQLTIDPIVLTYSTFLGGSGYDGGWDIAVDSTGNAYVTGQTDSIDFPLVNPRQVINNGTSDIFISKLNASGTAFVYSTYLGGSDGDFGRGIAVDNSGNAYISGQTVSANYPTMNAIQPMSRGGGDTFITKINSSGSALIYSTYHGGSGCEVSYGIAVDGGGNAYVTGLTCSDTDFPIVNAVQPTFGGGGFDAFVSKFNASGSALLYSTYLGGNFYELPIYEFVSGNRIAVDSSGNAYVTGTTNSTNFPLANARQNTIAGGYDAFITKFNASGSQLVYSTFHGGHGDDYGNAIAVDSNGNVYISGETSSTTGFPLVNAIQSIYGGGASDAFVSKFNAAGSTLVYSSYLGGTGLANCFGCGADIFGADTAYGIAVDSAGTAYIIGETFSANFPLKDPVQNVNGNVRDAFVTKVNTAGGLVYSSYYGGSSNDYGFAVAVDSSNNAYITGFTESVSNFPVINARQSVYGGGGFDVFIAKLTESTPCSQTPISFGQTLPSSLVNLDCTVNNRYADLYTFSGTAGKQISFSLNSTQFDAYLVLLDSSEQILLENNDGGSGTNSRLPSGTGFYTLPATGNYSVRVVTFAPATTGNYSVSLAEQLPGSCNYTLSTTSVNIPAAGSVGQTFTVTTNPGCGWTAIKGVPGTNLSWLEVKADQGGGSGTVSFDVAPNRAEARLATITVGGKTLTINQAAATSCQYAFRNPVITSGPNGGLFLAQVVTRSDCNWTATSTAPSWLTVTNGSSGTGTANIEGTIAPNAGTAFRTGSISINGGATVLTVNQDFFTGAINPNSNGLIDFGWISKQRESGNLIPGAVVCSYSLTPGNVQVSAKEGETSFSLNAAAGCPWNAVSNAPNWLEIVSERNFAGTVTFQLRAKANSGAVGRNGQISINGGQLLFTVTQAGTTAAVWHPPFDFDGDGKTDISVFRASENKWYILQSSNSAVVQKIFAIAGDLPVPADFDGDGKTDPAIFRPSNGDWWYLSSVDGGQKSVHWGAAGDVPRPSDFDGDGKADFIIFRPAEDNWYRFGSTGAVSISNFGLAGDKPVTGDFDGDGKSDVAIYRPSTGTWWYQSSISNAQLAARWGLATDIPAPADYDGDGKTDLAVYRADTGIWYIINSGSSTYTITKFGIAEDKPVAADYDGDGKADIAVYRPSTGTWYLLQTTAGFGASQFGISSDIPSPNAFVP